MKTWARTQKGFTIVELLIVVVVIAILATITIVAYNGITTQARASVVKNAVAQARDAVELYAVTNGGQYPATLSSAGISNSPSATYQYSADNGSSTPTYSITASDSPASSTTYYVSSVQRSITEGIAPGHNVAVWDEPSASSAPVAITTGVAVDTSVSRSSPASIRIAPSSTGKSLTKSSITGTSGQVVTVSFWLRTDSTWNGTGGNSKIRFGSSTGALITACSYEGVKTTWTFVTCSRTMDSTNTTFTLTVGNDGSTGNIWIDDLSVSIE